MNRCATIATAAFLSAAGCAADLDIGSESQEALAFNALAFNALSANFDANYEMTQKPLASEYYADSAGTAMSYQLNDPLTREFMKYLVSCALAPGQRVEYKDTLAGGTYHVFEGELGLCTEWGKGKADERCQEVVSACLLARNNAFGVPVELSMRGHDARGDALPVSEEEEVYFPVPEGAFYGNIFNTSALHPAVDIYVDPTLASPTGASNVVGRGFQVEGSIYRDMWSCWSPVYETTHWYQEWRVCAGGHSNCAATPVGACREHPWKGPFDVCKTDDENKDDKPYEYQGCQDKPIPGWPGGNQFQNAITVWLDDPCAIVNHDACRPSRLWKPGGKPKKRQ